MVQFSREGIPGAPADVLKAYETRLTAQGLTPRQVQTRLQTIRQYATDHPQDATRLHFNRIYTWADAPFTREPSAVVRKVAATRKPGKALDIAMGQGRNSVWLAKAGWTVTGYDVSDEALRQAQAAAAKAGLTLESTLASHDDFPLGEPQWDLIVMSFAFTKLSDAAYMQRVHDSLKPGGVLLVEGFHGGPRPDANPNEILKVFLLHYRVLLFEDLPDIADWGLHQAPLLRLALERLR